MCIRNNKLEKWLYTESRKKFSIENPKFELWKLVDNKRLAEEKGLVIREVYAQIPPRVEYTLTAVGYALKPVIESMVAWGAEYRENMMLGIENLA